MNNGFFEALSLLGSENSVDTEIIVEKVKSALLKAIRKAYPDCEDNIRVDIDPQTKKFDMFMIKTVVDDEPIDYNEINIDEARTIDPAAYVGGTVINFRIRKMNASPQRFPRLNLEAAQSP